MHQSVIFSILIICNLFISSYGYAQQPYDSWFDKNNPYGFPFEFPEDTHELIYESETKPFITLKKVNELLAEKNIGLATRLTLHWIAGWVGYQIADLSLMKENTDKGLLLSNNQEFRWLFYQFLILNAELNRQEGNSLKALTLLEEVLSWARKENDLYTLQNALSYKADVLNRMGNSTLALAVLQQLYTVSPSINSTLGVKGIIGTKEMVQFESINIHLKVGNFKKVYELTSAALSYNDKFFIQKNKTAILLRKSEAAYYLGKTAESFKLIEDAFVSANDPFDELAFYKTIIYKLRLELKTENILAAENTLKELALMKYVPDSIGNKFELDALHTEYFLVAKDKEKTSIMLRYLETQYDKNLLNYDQIKYFYQLHIRGSLLNNDPSEALEYSNLKLELIEKLYHDNIEDAVKQVSLLAEQQEAVRQKRIVENDLVVSTNKTLVMEKVQFWLIVGIFLLVLLLGLLSFFYRKNKDLMQKIKLLSVKDSLTGLNNRMQGLALIKQQSEVTKRNGEAFCLALIDLDKFKILNDTYGHQMGDKALQLFSNTAKEHCRTADVICRYGGEEFIIAFPNTDENTAHNVLCRLQDKLKIASHQLGIKDYLVTFSVGLVNAAKCPDLTSAIDLADQAMYAAKKQGRDRIILSTKGNNLSANTKVLFSS